MHVDRFDDRDIRPVVEAYDQRRGEIEGARAEAADARAPRPWSYAKARQYSRVQRDDFGTYIRKIGFDLS